MTKTAKFPSSTFMEYQERQKLHLVGGTSNQPMLPVVRPRQVGAAPSIFPEIVNNINKS